ncbi:MAG: hypothetical protein D6731_19205 [Planctomycetota bacterium]|nr:MAG: hypothetical protein D6731_19205 [Planctomycetota bacterium]
MKEGVESSLLVVCGCGSRLRAAERWAGRRVRCRRCGAVLRLPQGCEVVTGWEAWPRRGRAATRFPRGVPAIGAPAAVARSSGDRALGLLAAGSRPRASAGGGSRWAAAEGAPAASLDAPSAAVVGGRRGPRAAAPARCGSERLRLLPARERSGPEDPFLVRPGMRRSPAEVRRLEASFASAALRLPSEAVRRHARHLRALAVLLCASGALAFPLAAVAGLLRLAWGIDGLGAASLLLLAAGAFLLANGLELWRLRAWARTSAACLVGAGALGSVLGALVAWPWGLLALLPGAWSAAALWALCSPAAAAAVDAPRPPNSPRWWTSPLLWTPLVASVLGVGVGVALVLASLARALTTF